MMSSLIFMIYLQVIQPKRAKQLDSSYLLGQNKVCGGVQLQDSKQLPANAVSELAQGSVCCAVAEEANASHTAENEHLERTPQQAVVMVAPPPCSRAQWTILSVN